MAHEEYPIKAFSVKYPNIEDHFLNLKKLIL